MSNYIKSELFRLKKSKVLWGLVAVIAWWVIATSLSIEKGYFLRLIGDSMSIPYAISFIIGLAVTGECFKKNTIKESLSYGYSENRIYIYKIIVGIIIGACVFALVDVVAIPSAIMFNGKENIKYIGKLFQAEGVMFVACVASLVCFITIYFLCKRSIVSFFIWYAIAFLMASLVNMLGYSGLVAEEAVSFFVLSSSVSQSHIVNEALVDPWYAVEGIIRIFTSSTVMVALCMASKMLIKKKVK